MCGGLHLLQELLASDLTKLSIGHMLYLSVLERLRHDFYFLLILKAYFVQRVFIELMLLLVFFLLAMIPVLYSLYWQRYSDLQF